MTETNPSPSAKLPTEDTQSAESVFRIAIIMLVASVAVLSFYLFLAWQLNAWQMYALSGVIAAYTILAFAATQIIRAGRLKTGSWMLIIGMMVIFPSAVLLISNIGIIFGLTQAVLTYLVASQAFTSKGVRQASIAGAIVGILTAGIDLFRLDYRLFVQAIQTFVPTITVIIVLVVIAFIVSRTWSGSMRTKLIIAFLAATIVPLTIIAYLNDRSTRTALTDDANQALLSAASQTAAQLDAFIRERLNAARSNSQFAAVVDYLNLPASQRAGSPEEDRMNKFIYARLAQDPVFVSSVSILDINGNTLADTYTSDIGVNKADRPYFQRPIATGLPYVSDLDFSQTTNTASIYFSAPVRDAAGKIIGVVRTRYDAAILQDIMTSQTGLVGKSSFPILVDAKTHIRLAHGTTPSLVLKSAVPMSADKVKSLQAQRLLPPGAPETFSTNLPDFESALQNYENQPIFAAQLAATGATGLQQGAIVPIQTQKWLVIYAESQDVFLAPINAQARNNLIIAFVAIIAVAIFAIVMAQTLAGPVARLTQTAEKIAGGDIQAQAVVESKDEIGVLASTFNRMTAQLRDFISTLEERVAARTRNLELAAEVGRTVSQVRALDVMLTDAAELIRQQFDLYYVQVYLVNPSQTNLNLQAGTGHVGKQLLERSHRLPLDTNSINGRAAIEKKSVVISDTATSPTFKPNPLLPNTRSEMAVPLLVGNKVVGVLDMQSEHGGSLSTDILPAFEALAGQLAIAIQNATFLAETDQARAEVESQAKRLTRANWKDYLDAIHKPEETGFVFEKNKVVPFAQAEKTPDAANALAAPISVTGEVLGNLVLEIEGQSPIAHTDEFLNTVARQVSQQIESLRLLDSAERYRAEAEEASRRLTHESWKDYIESKKGGALSYMYDLTQVKPHDQNGQQPEEMEVSLPLKVRDEKIGKISIQGMESNNNDAMELVNAVAERLSAHIENLRLSQQTSERAQREQILRQITSAVRGSTDPEVIVRTAVRELGSIFGRKTMIQIKTTETEEPSDSHSRNQTSAATDQGSEA